MVAPAELERAARLHARGVDEQNRNRPGRALQLLERARGLLDAAGSTGSEPEVEALATAIWISLALTQAEIHGPDRGLATLDTARVRAQRSGDSALVVRVHSQHALIAMRAGRYDVAAEQLAAAEQMITHANDNDAFAIRINAGLLALLRHDLPQARRSLAAAVAAARAAGVRDWEFKAVHNLAYLDFLAGDLPRALGGMAAALAMGDDLPRGIPLLDRARVLVEAGLIREADGALTEAAAIFRRDRLAQDLAETELERARCALILGNTADARRLAARARDRFRRRGSTEWLRTAELVLLQGDLAAGRPGSRLAPPALRLYAELSADGRSIAARSAALLAVEALLRMGELGTATQLADSLPAFARHDPITTRLHDREVRARLALAGNAADGPATAARQVRSGLAELARHQSSFGSIDLQTAAAIHGRRLAELGILRALDVGRADGVLAAAERARAVSNRLPSLRPPDDPVAAELLTELRQVVESLHSAAPDPRETAGLLRRRRELERQVLGRGWSAAGLGDVAAVAALEQVRAELDGRRAQMAYFVEVASSLSVVVLGERVAVRPLGPSGVVNELVRRIRADLDVVSHPFVPRELRAAARASLVHALDALDAAVMGPVRAVARAEAGPLVIVSTGLLGQVPWGLLPSLRGRAVEVAPSATAWLRASRADPSRRRLRYALSGPDLARSSAEVSAIGLGWGRSGRVETAASCASTVRALGSGALVHIAAHGTHQTENPLFSSLRLTDGRLFAHELDHAVQTPDQVVLSACEVGLTTVRPGDEGLGLTSVLLRRGTRTVVAGVSRVADDLAAETMLDYHRRLVAGADPASALAAAVAAADGPAPFVCFGASPPGRGFGTRTSRRVP